MSQLKQSVKSLIKFFGLGQGVDKMRFYLQYFQQRGKISAFKAAYPGLPLPSPFMIYETFRLDYQRYIDSGKEDALAIYEEVKPFISLDGKAILDWGCGPGRTIRHFPEIIPSAHFYASDYNKEYVKWCQDNLKTVTFKENLLSPPIPYDACSIDFAYAISIFTHLSEEKHYEWINEMHRLLKPNGVFYFTTHGDITRKNLLDHERLQYDKGALVERGNVKEGNRMFTAYHPAPFIEKLLSGKFKILKRRKGIEKPWGLEQDVWIIKKIEL
jgi:SAM-dependent methyltransferase